MTTHEKALEAAIDACVADLPNGGAEIDIQRAITAYLSALLPEDAGRLVERLRTPADRYCTQSVREEAASLIQSQAARIAELAAVVADLATDLEAELNARYGMDPVHPAEARRKERDMEPVQRVRALLNGERKG